ncbi:MAG: spermidine/putrescine ABC transporter substrate-binding protein [Treponema sp.]|nr:spermidine/putrescine ABC transporter substrate-binding protein [Treponema sp.]
MMRKLTIALVFVLALTGCGKKSRMVLYTWSDMFPPEVIEGYEKDTGIKIQYVNFDSDETMIAKLKAAKGGSYDLIIADDYMIENVIQEGLAKKLDRSRLSNYRNINPIYQKQFYDPADDYTVPYGAGVQTIVYDPQKISFPINGYLDLWHPNLAQQVGTIDNYRVINGMALKVLGESYNTNDPDKIERAGELLKTLAPNIRLIRDDRLEEELLSGEISIAVMYTSQVTMAKLEKPELEVVFPSEGIGFGIMGAFIPSNAPNPDAAYAFLDYILDAERGARCFEHLGYYSTFSASDPLIEKEYREFLTLPENFKDFGSMEMIQNVSADAESLHNRVWTEFKSVAGR